MLDFDVVGQLIPNPFSMLVQLLSTLVLFFFVKKYLWKSIQNMLDARAEKMQSELAEAEQMRAEATELNEKAKAEIKEAGATARGIIESAKTEGAKLKEEMIKEAKESADQKLDAARREIEFEKKSMYDEVSKQIVDVALTATEKLLETKVTDEDDKAAIAKFVKDVNA